jgi:hypothetical protein
MLQVLINFVAAVHGSQRSMHGSCDQPFAVFCLILCMLACHHQPPDMRGVPNTCTIVANRQEVEQFVGQERIFADPVRTFAYGTDASFYRLNPKMVIKVITRGGSSSTPARARATAAGVAGRAALLHNLALQPRQQQQQQQRQGLVAVTSAATCAAGCSHLNALCCCAMWCTSSHARCWLTLASNQAAAAAAAAAGATRPSVPSSNSLATSTHVSCLNDVILTMV